MKKFFLTFVLALVLAIVPASAQINLGQLVATGIAIRQAVNVSDEQIIEYTKQYIAASDAQNKVSDPTSEYSQRLAKLVEGITDVEGMPLNFKVYEVNEVNAFACADGSVRVYSGLMDVMTDDEILGVLGHEMGHVAHKDVKNAFKQAMLNSALLQAAGSANQTVALITSSQVGTIAQALAKSKFSKKQENNADAYGYNYLKSHGRNPVAMVSALQRLQQLEAQNGSGSSAINQLFSSHPDIKSRVKNVAKMARKDGYQVDIK